MSLHAKTPPGSARPQFAPSLTAGRMALVDIERSPGAPTRHCVTRWMRTRFSGACLLAVLCAVPGISVRSARDGAQGWRACALPAANGFRQQDAGPVRRLMVLRGGSAQERGGRASQDQRTSREHAAACAELQNTMLELGTLLDDTNAEAFRAAGALCTGNSGATTGELHAPSNRAPPRPEVNEECGPAASEGAEDVSDQALASAAVFLGGTSRTVGKWPTAYGLGGRVVNLLAFGSEHAVAVVEDGERLQVLCSAAIALHTRLHMSLRIHRYYRLARVRAGSLAGALWAWMEANMPLSGAQCA